LIFKRISTVYFNRLGLFHFLKRPHDSIKIRLARPPVKKAHRYDIPVYTLPGQTPDPDLYPSNESEIEESEYENETL